MKKISIETERILRAHGHESLGDYFVHLSKIYMRPLEEVKELAETMGEIELFDGLVWALGYDLEGEEEE